MVNVADKKVLDPCCGSRMFWFDPKNKLVLFGDIRNESHILCDGRALKISPDMPLDFRKMPFDDGSFKLVVFDPPHLVNVGKKSWLGLKYGRLNNDWQNDIRDGFKECFRVLAKDGILIFKWNETQVKVLELLSLTDKIPLFGHKSGKAMNTHWITFINT
jgi:hypothetical protein